MKAESPAEHLNESLLEAVPLSSETTCAYFPDRLSRYREFSLAGDVPARLFDALLELGYRRCGDIYYQTQCPACSACRGYRIPIQAFAPRRSQRRVLKRNQDVELRVVEPELTSDKQSLYLRYQLHQHHQKDRQRDPDGEHRPFQVHRHIETMALQMYCNPPLSRELQLWLDDQLIGFGTLDLGQASISAVYFVFDPDHGDRSLGTLAILRGIEWAASHDYTWYHLGYYIADHPKMSYKHNFRPAEIHDPASGKWHPLQL